MEILSWKQIHGEQLNQAVSRQMFWGERVMVTRWELAADTQFPVHEHVSEQVTMVERGSVTLLFPDGEDVTLQPGEILVIPSSRPHGVRVGPEGCTVMDIFSPIRQDFIEGTATYIGKDAGPAGEAATSAPGEGSHEEKYRQLQGFLDARGMKIPMEALQDVPLDLLARYVYEKEAITMGQLRKVLGIDKAAAKELLRQWKHGDDHSESSYLRKLQRMVMLPWEETLGKPR